MKFFRSRSIRLFVFPFVRGMVRGWRLLAGRVDRLFSRGNRRGRRAGFRSAAGQGEWREGAAEVRGDAPSMPLEPDNVFVCRDLASGIRSADLKGLVCSRLADMDMEQPGSEAWGLAAVDFFDELSLLAEGCEAADADVVLSLQKALPGLLALHGCKLLDESEWNPQVQRATSIDRCLSEGERPRLVRKFSSGLMVEGKLIRKQEVKLQLAVN